MDIPVVNLTKDKWNYTYICESVNILFNTASQAVGDIVVNCKFYVVRFNAHQTSLIRVKLH